MPVVVYEIEKFSPYGIGPKTQKVVVSRLLSSLKWKEIPKLRRKKAFNFQQATTSSCFEAKIETKRTQLFLSFTTKMSSSS